MKLAAIVSASCDQLSEALHVLSALTGAQYRAPNSLINGASVGQHWRHLSDHYACFLSGIDEGVVDYGDRCRDPRTETDLAFAQSEAREWLVKLAALAEIADQPLQVRHEPADAETSANSSCVARELEFLFSHSSHHLAMISVVLRKLSVAVPPDFGLAASTRRYRAASSKASGQPA